MSGDFKNYEVAIVGLGVVGSALANILGKYGIRTVALDRETSAYNLPRAVMFDDEIMRIFQSMGLAKKIEGISEIGGGAKFLNAGGATLVHWSRPEMISPNGWYVNYRFHQPDLEKILREGYRRYPQIIEKWGCEVTRVEQDQDGITLRYRETPFASENSLRASYVIGCDGARSFIRSAINTEIDDLGFHEPWLVIDLLMNIPQKIENRESFHFCEPERSGTYVFLGAKRKRWEFRLNPDDNPEEICKPEFIWPLLKRWITPAEAKIERATVYTFHSTISKQWCDRRLFIAGDAAHQTPPFMGQGMCAGIRDIMNISWKLKEILRNGASETLLESYQIERYPHVKQYIDLTIQMGQMINQTSSAIVAGNATDPKKGPQTLSQFKPSLGSGLGIGASPLVGSLFPQPRINSGNLLDEYLDINFALIVSRTFKQNLTETDFKQFREKEIKIVIDQTDQLELWFEKKGVGAVLLRPDRYILGIANKKSDLETLLAFFKK